jgi:hypothetical protein
MDAALLGVLATLQQAALLVARGDASLNADVATKMCVRVVRVPARASVGRAGGWSPWKRHVGERRVVAAWCSSGCLAGPGAREGR